ncbi:enoyl-CoA hydratase/isomerase family protein [Piscinibacter koreensis]|jgi:enoyl-CoA hydratase/carnithine racemase|uniref:Enoyl-CoA hydratase/isomerase family protein n=1 Tax=Piscinibacter koreensis TaxID=2742824 RepID=A0A7Y6NTC7_9BURK|nr:enoyl-CoA hydratase/isomerase family protein [Schlegelella koreensis]NUZ08827.1 enoyl-CoA hydratase/isomerase family protein [Schlegelella koreensis]
MNDTPSTPAVGVHKQGHVAIVEIRRPPHNYFDAAMIQGIADAFEALEGDAACRAIVLCSQGTAFCAGANFATRDAAPPQRSPRAVNPLYFEAIRLVACTKPVIAAVHGPAIGGGLGLALAADFRVTCAEARFSANFNRLGIHPGFGLSYMLPRLVGQQQASLLFYTGRRIAGEEAVRIGLADQLVPQPEVRSKAIELAEEIAASSPVAVQSTRSTLRAGLVEQFRLAVARESIEQNIHFETEDFQEGVRAMSERRMPRFKGH